MRDGRDVGRRRRALLAAAVTSGLALGPGCGAPAPRAPQVAEVTGAAAAERIVITGPPGTGVPGASPFPDRVELEVGQVLTIENRGPFGADVGPFYVPPRATRSYRMESPGRYTGACSLHPSGRFTLVVR
ncbi:MAG: hypothetical protein KatS3mg009_0405 [Acidimicrobiia bacterium]|nr:MAG: hypothetical protein KatS3mg009_0405 [Acidimicrobiia bacterium]